MSLLPTLSWTSHMDPHRTGKGHSCIDLQSPRRQGEQDIDGLFLICSFFFFAYVPFFPLLSLPPFTPSCSQCLPHPPYSSCCPVSPHKQMLIHSDAAPLWSAWHWASCLGVDKGNRVFLLLGSLGLRTKPSCCAKCLFQRLKRLKNTPGSHRAAPETFLFPSEVSPFQNPTSPSTWLRGARCAFGRMCIWFCAQYLGTVKLRFIYHKGRSV